MIYPDLSLEIPDELGRVHFVGIGGSGMSGIARMMHNAGVKITGSDRSENFNTLALRELGVPIAIGHAAENVGDVDTLVVTGALWEDNPEYQWALANNIPVLHRSHALTWLSRGHKILSVAGAHGKTTTTGMIVTALLDLDADPSFVNGGVIEPYGISAQAGTGDTFVIEADESDKSFLLYDTSIALITNVDPEHLDFYGGREAFMQAFVDFADQAHDLVIISADDPGAREVIERLSGNDMLTFGADEHADVRLVDADEAQPMTFSLEYRGERFTSQLSAFGYHNALNAAGAFAALVSLGHDPAASMSALSTFQGTKRRFEFHADIGGVRVFDDYAHHPTEIDVLLESARTVVGGGRLIAIHQPHLYSRTQTFAREFAEVLESRADYTVVLEVDGAREDPVPGVTGELVSEKFRDPSNVVYIDDWQRAAEHLAAIAQPGDVMITMSCGSVYRMIPQLTEALEKRFTAEERERAEADR